MICLLEPFSIKHVMTPASLCDHTLQLARVRMRHSNGVVASCAERPHHLLRLIDPLLLFNPVEHAIPHALGRRWIHWCGRIVTSARNLDDHAGAALAPPSLDPHGQLSAVTIEASDDDNQWDGRGRGSVRREVIIDREDLAVGGLRMRMWDLDLLDWVFAKALGILARAGLMKEKVEGGKPFPDR